MGAKPLGIGLIGAGRIGRVHAANLALRVPEASLVAVADVHEEAAQQVAAQWRADYATGDYRRLLEDPAIGAVMVCSATDTHAPIIIDAAVAGKHIFCEKPLANTLAEARQMRDAVARAGVIGMVNFNYRRVPAVELARRLIAAGRLGRIYHWRAVYLQEWIMDPNFPLVWRLQKDVAGTGALGDLGAHIVDLARMLVGEIEAVTGLTKTFIEQRPVELASDASLGAIAGDSMGTVTVDDAALFLARFTNGAVGSFEVTRFAKGRANFNSFEINGEQGSIVFNLERMNELQLLLADEQADVAGFRTLLVTDGANHPYVGAWWPAGHIIGWEHTFTHGVYDLLNGIVEGVAPAPNFEDGLRCQAVLDAVERSAGSKQWVEPDY